LQPIVAIFLGARSGVKDAKAGLPPFIWALFFHGEHRRELLKSMFASIRDLAAVAILLDIVSQFLIFHEVRPGAALVVGPVLITLPYAVSRAATNRLVRKSSHVVPVTQMK
jgi:drug/metabolite transporter (DMT)-like permease